MELIGLILLAAVSVTALVLASRSKYYWRQQANAYAAAARALTEENRKLRQQLDLLGAISASDEVLGSPADPVLHLDFDERR